ncbi:MAG: RING finger domain-containing protein, partial [Legionella sp.]|nr:RING finger domain-containing protein [Legionella sp.]
MRKSFKVLSKKIVRDGARPTADTVFLSRLHFHRIVIDEFHKQGGLSVDTALVDSDYLWLVSGTPLDTDIGRFMKRFGIMDYSFVDPDDLRFVTETPDDVYIFHNNREYMQGVFRSSNVYKPWTEFLTKWNPEQERLRFYSAPPSVACNFSRIGIISQFMVRNTVETCPELANVRVTENIIKLQHNDKEKEKYLETLQKVRIELDGMRARGTLQTRILFVLTLLNNLRRAAVDPFGVTIQIRDALVVGDGAQFDRENERYNIQLVPVDVFAHLLYPETFPSLLPRFDGAAPNPADGAFAHVKIMPKIESLKNELIGMMKQPPEVETCMICRETLDHPCVAICGHQYCRECILQWMQRGNAANCPACRRDSLSHAK